MKIRRPVLSLLSCVVALTVFLSAASASLYARHAVAEQEPLQTEHPQIDAAVSKGETSPNSAGASSGADTSGGSGIVTEPEPAPSANPSSQNTPAPSQTPLTADEGSPLPSAADTPHPDSGGVTDEPGETLAATDTPQPGDTPAPQITIEPSDTPGPEITAGPSATPAPDDGSVPLDSPDPEASGEPVITPENSETPVPDATPAAEETADPAETGITGDPQEQPAESAPTPAPAERGLVEADFKKNQSTWDGVVEYGEGGMPIPQLFQFNFRETVCRYNGVPRSVSSSGCNVTCLSMVIRYLTGNEKQTPVELFHYAVRHGLYHGDGLGHTEMSKVAKAYGVSGRWVGRSEAEITAALRNGHPVIAHMGRGIFTRGGHYIVLRGVTEDGKLLLNDPNSKKRSRLAFPIKTILRQARTSEPFFITSAIPGSSAPSFDEDGLTIIELDFSQDYENLGFEDDINALVGTDDEYMRQQLELLEAAERADDLFDADMSDGIVELLETAENRNKKQQRRIDIDLGSELLDPEPYGKEVFLSLG